MENYFGKPERCLDVKLLQLSGSCKIIQLGLRAPQTKLSQLWERLRTSHCSWELLSTSDLIKEKTNKQANKFISELTENETELLVFQIAPIYT